MSRLRELYEVAGQSPWLDNLKRTWIEDGTLEGWIRRGCRGITSNPTIFQKAMSSGDAYDRDLAELTAGGAGTEETYWHLVAADIAAAARLLEPTHGADPADGFVSVEVAPDLAHDAAATVAAARQLHQRIAAPNLYVKVPATAAGVEALKALTAEGHSVNVTLIFSLARYEQVIEAYLAGLEARSGRLDGISGVASFFVSRVDTEVDRRLEAIATPAAAALTGRCALAQAKRAYAIFQERFSGARWEALEARGARLQRPLWASTSTKNPAYPDTLYVDGLIGPHTVNTLPDATLDAFEDHGTVAQTLTADAAEAAEVLERLNEVGVDLAAVSNLLEAEGVAAFAKSFDELLATLEGRAQELTA